MGAWTGDAGALLSDGARPIHERTLDTKLVTTFTGATGVDAAGTACASAMDSCTERATDVALVFGTALGYSAAFVAAVTRAAGSGRFVGSRSASTGTSAGPPVFGVSTAWREFGIDAAGGSVTAMPEVSGGFGVDAVAVDVVAGSSEGVVVDAGDKSGSDGLLVADSLAGTDTSASLVVSAAATVPSGDVVTVVFAPPEARTTGPGLVTASGSDVGDVPDDDVVELAELAESGDSAELVVPVEDVVLESDAALPVAEVPESDDDVESEVSATATAGVVAIAAPIPSATASAPTRPIYLA